MEDIKGLSTEEVKKRIEEGKVNNSHTDNLKSNWQIVRDNVCTLFNLFNLIIAIALACVHAYTNMVFILIIIVNVLIGIIQEIHGKNLVKKLSILTVAKTKVIRNGKEEEIKINEIVLDDVILLAQGDQIPSDAYVLEGEIEVNESLLTGESDTILKEKEDKLLSGSYVVSGKCYAKIEKVGDDNFANQIINATKKHKKINSELLNSMKKVTNFTSFVIIPVGVILFIQAYIFRENFMKELEDLKDNTPEFQKVYDYFKNIYNPITFFNTTQKSQALQDFFVWYKDPETYADFKNTEELTEYIMNKYK